MIIQKSLNWPASRVYHACCNVDNKIWMYGGLLISKKNTYLSDFWVCDPEKFEWQKLEFDNSKHFQMHPIAYHSMTPVFTKKIFNSDGTIKNFVPSRYDKINVFFMKIIICNSEFEYGNIYFWW